MIPVPGPHGGDGPAVAAALGVDPTSVLDLSVSMNPFAPDAAPLVVRHAATLRRYPDAAAVTREVAAVFATDPARLVLTNGGSEAIALVGGAIGGRVASEPEFSLHPRGRTGPVWRSNPNNPTGRLAGPGEVADVWDEAFHPLATGAWTRGDGPVVVGSFTKVFACPGLRLGYVLADEAATLAAAQPAWSVGSLALAVLVDLLERADLPGWCRAIARRRSELAAMLTAHGLEAVAADAPWVLVEAPGLRGDLAARGVVVRDASSFGLDGWVRIGLPDDHGMDRLEEALRCVAR